MKAERPCTVALVIALALAAPSVSHARPPNTTERGFRDGVNHHAGDDSFVESFGRAPRAGDSEEVRMHAHFVRVREKLAAGAPTKPGLAPMRARILAALDDYIAKGTTPENDHLPWRNPVFIDDDGTICAVGYLIEQTAGRALAEKVAATHRYDVIDDIAVAMPEVARWVAESGLTLEEFASIQPGYIQPVVERWHALDVSTDPIADGPFDRTTKDGRVTGVVERGRMEGAWTRIDTKERVVGSGELRNGAGTWRSSYADGSIMGEGPFVRNAPGGDWKLFHPSGNLAAEGRFLRGYRDGAWRFFHDESDETPIASGRFSEGQAVGAWRHFGADGNLVGVSRPATPWQWDTSTGAFLFEIVPDEDGVRHWIHQGDVGGGHRRLDMLARGRERLFVAVETNDVYDASGQKLTETDGTLRASDCKWRPSRLRAAAAGDLVSLDGTFQHDRDTEVCGVGRPVSKARAERIEAMLAKVRGVRDVNPDLIRDLTMEGLSAEDQTLEQGEEHLSKSVATNLSWYVEWPEVEGRFIALFRTLPGYARGAPEKTQTPHPYAGATAPLASM